MDYNIQINDGGFSWEDVPSKTINTNTRKEVVDFCYKLSHVLDGKEVRLSEGDDMKLSNGQRVGSEGTYIRM